MPTPKIFEMTYSFMQFAGSTQVTSKLHTRTDLAGIEVVTLVKCLAKKEHSAAIAQLASRISAGLRFGGSAREDPFTKVRTLISDMISELEAEAGSEAAGRTYCEEQMAKLLLLMCSWLASQPLGRGRLARLVPARF